MSKPSRALGASFLALSLHLPAADAAAGGHQGAARLVADLGPNRGSAASENPVLVSQAGARVVYLASWGDGRHFESALAASDGTLEGTRLLANFCGPGELLEFGFVATTAERAFMRIRCLSGPRELWSTDGTSEGTTRLRPIYDDELLIPVPVSENRIASFGCLGSTCYLLITDGTPAGTVEAVALPSLRIGSSTNDWRPMIWTGSLLFFATRSEDSQRQLWVSDLTAAGTHVLRTANDTYGFPYLTVAGGKAFFIFANGNSFALGSSDGTAAGTGAVSVPGTWPDSILDGTSTKLFFMAQEGGQFGRQMWSFDIATSSAAQLTNAPNTSLFVPSGLFSAGSRWVFSAPDATGAARLWATDGTPSSAAPIGACAGGCPTDVTIVGSLGKRAVFFGRRGNGNPDLWSSDGTGQGTAVLHPGCGAGTITPVAVSDSIVYLAQGCQKTGLWFSDGTPAGTRRLDTSTFNFTVGATAAKAAGIYYAPLTRGITELWRIDGTPRGTRPITAIGRTDPGYGPWRATAFQGGVLFGLCGEGGDLWYVASPNQLRGPIPVPGIGCSEPEDVPPTVIGGQALWLAGSGLQHHLWRTDGTVPGTTRLTHAADAFGQLLPWGSKVVFLRGLSYGSNSVWSSDGTTSGTHLLVNLPDTLSGPTLLGTVGGNFLFQAVGQQGATQLWISDGTPAGTHLLKDLGFLILPEREVATGLGGRALFRAGSGGLFHLWATDGTASGTLPLDGSGSEGGNAGSPTLYQGKLFYFADHDGAPALWSTDGTPAGTAVVYAPGANQQILGPAVPFKGRLYFAGADAVHGRELWRSDGTAAGTSRFADILPGSLSSTPHTLTATPESLFFAAADDASGTELWETDGSPEGTRRVQDISPGLSSAFPERLVAIADRLYFSADDGAHGRELWSVPFVDAGCEASPTALCLRGRRFRVEAFWRDFQGNTGEGMSHGLTDDTGYFWFFDPANVELMTKVLDGRGLNDHFWTFYGALSSVTYHLTVTDQETGAARRYVNPSGVLGSLADTSSFGPNAALYTSEWLVPQPSSSPEVRPESSAPVESGCVEAPSRLCLRNGRFSVEISWRDFSGASGEGQASVLSSDTGYFWFFDPANVEVVVKILDGRAVNGKFWVFYGALSTVDYTITITDTATGARKTYHNPAGRLASVADTNAL